MTVLEFADKCSPFTMRVNCLSRISAPLHHFLRSQFAMRKNLAKFIKAVALEGVLKYAERTCGKCAVAFPSIDHRPKALPRAHTFESGDPVRTRGRRVSARAGTHVHCTAGAPNDRMTFIMLCISETPRFFFLAECHVKMCRSKKH